MSASANLQHASNPALFPPHLLEKSAIAAKIYQSPGDILRAKKYISPKKNTDGTPPPKRKKRNDPNDADIHLGRFRDKFADENERNFRHHHWEAERQLVRRHILKSGCTATALHSYDQCGAECTVEWSDSAQRYRLRATYCKSRHCRPCAKAKAGLISANLRKKMQPGKTLESMRYRFFTFTLKHSAKPLTDQIKRLYKCFAKLRKTDLWVNTQNGGAMMFETHQNLAKEWHPHLHVIADGNFVNAEKLSKEWKRITGDSHRVDVKAVKSAKDAVYYVSKYVTKGVPDQVWNSDDAAQEWIAASRGLRTCATFGSWRGYRLLAHDDLDTVRDWKAVGLLTRICESARTGVMADILLLMALEEAHQYDPHRARPSRQKAVKIDGS